MKIILQRGREVSYCLEFDKPEEFDKLLPIKIKLDKIVDDTIKKAEEYKKNKAIETAEKTRLTKLAKKGIKT